MHREVYLSAVMDAVFLEDGNTVVIALRNSNYLRLFSLAKLEVGAPWLGLPASCILLASLGSRGQLAIQ